MPLASRLNRSELRFEPGQRILKAQSYQRFVEAEEILSQARDIAANIEDAAKDAYHRAEREGHANGIARANEESAQRLLQSVFQAISWMREMEEDLAASVLKALEKLVGTLDINELTIRLVKKALREYRNLPDISLHVAPSQVAAVEESLAELYREVKPTQLVRVEADSRMQPGDCMLKSPLGTVDISLTQQLDALRKQLAVTTNEKAA